MAIVPISLLYQINEVLEKTHSLQKKVEARKAAILSLQVKNSKEESLYQKNQIEIQIQNKILEGFGKMQVQFLEAERKIKLDIGKIVDKAINSFLTSENILKIIKNIEKDNPDTKMVIQADPEIARNLSLDSTVVGGSGVLKLIFNSKSYFLNPESLKDGLRKELLVKSLSK